MELRIFTEPQQGASYDDLLRVARATEELGFDAFFRSDHFLHMGDVDPEPGPTDAWVTLAGLARDTTSIRLGTLVTSATFRYPGPLAVQVAQVDQMSGGRVEFGLGTGWYEAEHRAYGVPFPSVSERFGLLEEQLAIVVGLWNTPAGETFGYRGSYYEVADSPALPKPTQRPYPPVIIGGAGKRRTPALAAAYAAEFNAPFLTVADAREAYARVHAACGAANRDPATMRYSVAVPIFCGKDAAEVDRRLTTVGRNKEAIVDEAALVGSPDQVVDTIGQYAEAGASRVYLQVLDLDDMDHIEYVASEVLRQV